MCECKTEKNTCSDEHENDCCSETQSDCGTESCCPVEGVIEKWEMAFCHAKEDVMIEILKEKIKTKWGDKMNQVGDAVIEAMDEQWQSSLKKSKSHETLREKVSKVLFST